MWNPGRDEPSPWPGRSVGSHPAGRWSLNSTVTHEPSTVDGTDDEVVCETLDELVGSVEDTTVDAVVDDSVEGDAESDPAHDERARPAIMTASSQRMEIRLTISLSNQLAHLDEDIT